MTRTPLLLAGLALTVLRALTAAPAAASMAGAGFGLSVIVDGAARPEYAARGTLYIEALRDREYSLRLTNPLGVRVAVALSVDGLNTIDARHAPAWGSQKWVLEPYETIVLEGWQVSGGTARKFVFTGEKDSYGARLGQTGNLGVIEAVFFRERPRPVAIDRSAPAAPAPAGETAGSAARAESSVKSSALSDEYAATGMGGRTRHDVVEMRLELDPTPAASVRIRYEFRPVLEALGVLPRPENPLDRRERSRGFDSWCPER
ncbi:MAG: hypothetical protein ACHQPI_01145 [Thermoanaerobaculia bacterium]